jgi:hypothetical protein
MQEKILATYLPSSSVVKDLRFGPSSVLFFPASLSVTSPSQWRKNYTEREIQGPFHHPLYSAPNVAHVSYTVKKVTVFPSPAGIYITNQTLPGRE